VNSRVKDTAWVPPGIRDSTVILTGACSGIGAEYLRAFAAAGANIVGMDLPQAVPTARDPDGAILIAGDVTSDSDWASAVDRALSEFGRVDILVNNAGMAPQYATLPGVTEELFDKTIAVNLKGPFRLCALVGERMAAGDGGSIINVSSTGAVRPTGDIVPYAAAKAGLNAMTVGFADALGPKVRVNGIMPGPFLTTIAETWDMDMVDDLTRAFPLRRPGQPDEIVGAALYLASDASSFTTGSILTVDGGATWARPGGGNAR
jgi:NAD(P)-dependent dehydrogenase (short-subunit alcohol dehydrogenase family)